MPVKPVKIELLSPARNVEIGIEAISCGADAVYIGAEAFGARHAAGNSVEDIGKLCNYAHRYGGKVYVTINTILYDNELEQARRLIDRLYSAGVDALITQDTALLKMDLPLPLHASTQMDVRSLERVRQLSAWGFKQAVIARELSLQEIANIHRHCPQMKLEAFVHGALCVCYSGQCYASQYLFGRSANRGECAQVCRLAFDLEDEKGHVLVKNKHLLSLKDMNRSAYIEQMLNAGVTSFKIEGRLKDMAYVKNTTAYYSDVLNNIVHHNENKYCRSAFGQCRVSFQPDLNKTFNRGFTDYFIEGRKHDVASIHTPKAIGESVGYVKEIRKGYILVGGVSSFNNGDGICYYDRQGTLKGFRVNRVENNKIFPYGAISDLTIKAPLFRNYDADFDNQLAKPTPQRTVLLNLHVKEEDAGFVLSAQDEVGRSACLHVVCAKELVKTPQQKIIAQELRQTGGTYFEVADVKLDLKQDFFIPKSFLGKWRRALLEKFQQENPYSRNKSVSDRDGIAETQRDFCAVPLNDAQLQQSDTADQFNNAATQFKSTVVQPEDVALQHENAVAQPEDVSLLQEDTIARPKGAVLQPRDVSVQANDATAQSKATVAQPEGAALQQEDTIAQPKDVSLQTDKTLAQSDDAVCGKIDYSANVSNRLARDFYLQHGAKEISPAFEITQPMQPLTLMTCKHCIRYSLGQCLRDRNANKSTVFDAKLPPKLYLRMQGRERLALEFDCAKCEMRIMAEN